eukprot:4687386-Prymnesium_polylepis.1
MRSARESHIPFELGIVLQCCRVGCPAIHRTLGEPAQARAQLPVAVIRSILVEHGVECVLAWLRSVAVGAQRLHKSHHRRCLPRRRRRQDEGDPAAVAVGLDVLRRPRLLDRFE